MPDTLASLGARLADQLDELRATETRVAMATLVAARGGSPRPLGAKLLVGEGGRLLGSVSIGGCVDARVVEHGDRLLRENRRARVTVRVDDVEAIALGLTCGAEFDLVVEPVSLQGPDPVVDAYREAWTHARAGRTAWIVRPRDGMEPRVTTEAAGPVVPRRSGAYESANGDYFVETITPPDSLVIVGASDVAAALARFARTLGLRVAVIDGRERFATRERFPAADEVLTGMPSELVRGRLDAGASLVLVTHDYKYELPVLRDALRSDARYIGMLAGRKRAESMRALLREEGFTDDELARLHAPIGLDIGGREPEEIAVSIIAQLIAVREGKPIASRGPGAPRRSAAGSAARAGRD